MLGVVVGRIDLVVVVGVFEVRWVVAAACFEGVVVALELVQLVSAAAGLPAEWGTAGCLAVRGGCCLYRVVGHYVWMLE